MKNIAYFSTQFTTVKSGPGRFVQYLTELQSDHLSFVFISDDIPIHSSGENILICPQIKVIHRLPFYWIVRAYLFYRTFLQWTKKENQVDAIVCSSAFEALFLLRLKKKTPVYIMINDYKYLESRIRFKEMLSSLTFNKTISRWILFYVEQYVARKASHVFTNSNYIKNTISPIYHLPDHKISVLYKAVDSHFFIYKHREKLNVTNFLFTKNDWRTGGLDIVLSALSKLDWQEEITLTLAGMSSSENTTIRNVIKRSHFKGKFVIHSFMEKKALLHLLHHSDIHISMPREESFGVSMLEAMSTGLPVITSDEGGIKELLDNGTSGIMIKNKDITDLTDLLNNIRKNPDVLQPIIQKARLQSLKFSKEKMKDRLEHLFLSLLNQ